MKDLAKVTIKEVKAAYKNLGWKPMKNEWHCKLDGQSMCCGISALVCSNQKNRKKKYSSLTNGEIFALAEALFGTNEVNAFVDGFDSGAYYPNRYFTPGLQAIYENGNKIAKAVNAVS